MEKNIATLVARYALAGWALYRVQDHDGERYLACRWTSVRELPDLHAAEAFLVQIGERPWALVPADGGRRG